MEIDDAIHKLAIACQMEGGRLNEVVLGRRAFCRLQLEFERRAFRGGTVRASYDPSEMTFFTASGPVRILKELEDDERIIVVEPKMKAIEE